MNMITRHNYEEFFFLYMDNELSSDDRRMVEAFVQQHPDLKEELDILLQYKLVPDTGIVFEGKDELIKVNGDTPVTLSNYEEWLVLYIDNELTPCQQETVEAFLAAHPEVHTTFALLQRSKLQPEPIVFADKSFLYRKEEKVRVIPLRWWRVAAAVFILAFGLTTFILVNNKPSGNKGNEIATVPANDNPVTVPAKQDAVAGQEIPVNPSLINEPGPVAVNQQHDRVKDPLPKNSITEKKVNEPIMAVNTDKPTNNLPQPLNNSNNIKETNTTIASNDIPKEIINPNNLPAAVTNTSASPSNIVQASYPGDNEELDQTSGKKNKLRGFFRKVTRTFEKRTNIDATNEDDRLLVAGLAIKMK